MKLAKWCWILVVCGTVTVQARGQYPEVMPTLPRLPVVIEATPPSLQELPAPSTLPPSLLPPREFPGDDQEPPYPTDRERPAAPERIFPPSGGPTTTTPAQPTIPPAQPTAPPAQPTAPMATPAVTYLPEAVPARPRLTFGEVIYALLHPFRRVSPNCQMSEQPTTSAGPFSQAELAATTIKADEANVDRRRTAVRYLGGVDCTFNPEAEAGLVTALRNDRHESVRYEAALALSNSWCWTKKTVEALNHAMTGTSADGNPAERSDRVRWAAWQALSRYAAAVNPPQPKDLPHQLPTSQIQRVGAVVPPPQASNSYFRPSPTKAPPAPAIDPSRLPPLRPIAPIPEAQPPEPTYEPTPIQMPIVTDSSSTRNR